MRLPCGTDNGRAALLYMKLYVSKTAAARSAKKDCLMKKIISLICTLALSLSLLCGCGSSSDAGSSSSGETDTAKSITIGAGQACDTLDPANSYDGWYIVRYGISETLTKMEDDMSISMWLAESYTVSEDYTTWTFTIKDGITFSNGNPVDGEAAASSLIYIFETSARGEEYFTPVSITGSGQDVTIVCESAEPILMNKLADPLFCIIDTSVDLTDIADEGPIGCGPFIIESFDATTKTCVVVKNENYWDGEVNLDRVTFLYTEDQSTLTLGLTAGDYDAVYNLSMTAISDFETDDYTISRAASARTTHGFMNQNGALGDDALRQAILMAIDKETYCETLLNGEYTAGKTLITSSAPQYGYDELEDPYAYDPEAAEALLDSAGYIDIDGDGFREDPDGNELELIYVYYQGRPEQQIVVEATQAELAELGIKITIEVNDTATVIERLAAGDFDLLCMSINVLNCADPENHLYSYFKSGGTYANYGWSNEEFDAILEELSVTADADERAELVKEAQAILLDGAVCIYYCYPIMNFVMKSSVTGLCSTTADYYWISAETDVNQ